MPKMYQNDSMRIRNGAWAGVDGHDVTCDAPPAQENKVCSSYPSNPV